MRDFVRLRFRANKPVDARNSERINALIKAGAEELEAMNYYHSVRRAKDLRAANSAANSASAATAATAAQS